MPKPRRSVRFEAWPDIDQALWREAVRDDDLLADVGVAARWAPRTRETVSKGYGDWLFWLEGQNHLDPAAAPEDRCSPR